MTLYQRYLIGFSAAATGATLPGEASGLPEDDAACALGITDGLVARNGSAQGMLRGRVAVRDMVDELFAVPPHSG